MPDPDGRSGEADADAPRGPRPRDPDPPPGLPYERRLAIFLDIVGWTSAVADSASDPARRQKLLGVLEYVPAAIRQAAFDGIDDGAPRDAFQMSQFSDSMLLSVRLAGPEEAQRATSAMFQAIATVSQDLLVAELPIRGGVTIGPLFHRDSVAFGPALVEAHAVESTLATYPRVALARSHAQEILDVMRAGSAPEQPLGRRRIIDYAPDDLFFVNFLRPIAEMRLTNLNRHFDRFRRPILAGLHAAAGNPARHLKYDWLRQYFNRLLTDYCPGVGGIE